MRYLVSRRHAGLDPVRQRHGAFRWKRSDQRGASRSARQPNALHTPASSDAVPAYRSKSPQRGEKAWGFDGAARGINTFSTARADCDNHPRCDRRPGRRWPPKGGCAGRGPITEGGSRWRSGPSPALESGWNWDRKEGGGRSADSVDDERQARGQTNLRSRLRTTSWTAIARERSTTRPSRPAAIGWFQQNPSRWTLSPHFQLRRRAGPKWKVAVGMR